MSRKFGITIRVGDADDPEVAASVTEAVSKAAM